MPLRAFVDGVEVIAPALSDAEWDALREAGATVILPCCGSEGYLRRSAMGTPHFAHKRGGQQCETAGETIYHLKAKADVVLACQQAGYTAVTEVAGEGWRADVLAVKGSVRIAFEVQWSFLRLEDALYRQERYARDGVRGCWFFRNPPPSLVRGDDLKALHDLPLFHLYSNGDNTFSLNVNGQLRGLGEVVQALLHGEIRFCETAKARDQQTLEIAPFEIKCPHCGGMTHVYRVAPTLTAQCGRRFKSAPLEFRREVLAAVRALAKAQPHLHFGAFQDVMHDGKKELRFGCAHCSSAISPEEIEMALYGAAHLLYGERYPITVQFQRPITTRTAHWCFPDDGNFCCES
jgi:hypothetical protein